MTPPARGGAQSGVPSPMAEKQIVTGGKEAWKKSFAPANPSLAGAERQSDSDRARGVWLCLVITVREQSLHQQAPSALITTQLTAPLS